MSKLRHTLKAAIAALALGLMAQAASAATLYISEFQNGVGVVGSTQVQAAPQTAVTDQTVAIGGGSVASAAFNAKTHFVLLTCDIGCSIAIGSSPTATTSNFLLSAGAQTPFVVTPGQQVAVIANSAGGSGSGSVVVPGTISATNSSSTPLAGGAAFTGTSVSTINYGSIVVTVFADQASATNGLSIQQSSDGTNWDITDTYTVSASTSSKIVVPRQAAFARVVYTNGATPQTAFRLQTILNSQMPAPSSVKPADGLTLENDFTEVLSANLLSNGTTLDVGRAVTNGTNSIGTGITAMGNLAQFDDVSPTTITENSFGNTRMSVDHIPYMAPAPTASVGAGLTSVSSTAVESNHVIKAGAGNLYGFQVTTGATAGFVFVANSTTAPTAGGAAIAPIKCYAVAANSTLGVSFAPVPLALSTGITLVFSTTGCFTNTASSTAFFSGDAK